MAYQSPATVKNLTASILVELEELMRSFPSQLARYAKAHDIHLTRIDELQIYGCFRLDIMDDFENFAFRHGDKTLILSVAKFIEAKMRCRHSKAPLKDNCTFFEFCNPNSEQSTVSTIVGTFYGEDGIINQNSIASLTGMTVICN